MLRAKDIMTKDVETVRADLPLAELDQAFLTHGVSGFPVLEGERLVGVVSRSDVIRKLSVETSISGQISDYYRDVHPSGAGEPFSARAEASEVGVRIADSTVADVMCRSVDSVQVDDSVQIVARKMIDRGFHRVPVLEDERLAGIITSLDLVRVVAEFGTSATETRRDPGWVDL